VSAASTAERSATGEAGILDPVPCRHRRAGWAWLAGGDGFVLATVPSEASFLAGLGMWVAGMALVSGFAMTVAASQWWSTSIPRVLWVLPLWAVLYCLIERLVLKSFGTGRRWNLVIAIPRLVLSLAIALVVGLPMAQVIYSGSINDELNKTTTARIHQATNEIMRVYDAKIATAQKEIAAVERKEASLQRQVTNSTFLSECEAGEVSCSQTPKLGCGPYCKRDARPAAAAAAALKRARPRFEATIAADRRKIALWQAAETGQIAKRVAAIKADRDVLAARRRSSGSRRRTRPSRNTSSSPRLPDRDRPRRAHPQADPLPQYRRCVRANRGGTPGDRPRRNAPPRRAGSRPHPPHHPRGPGTGGRGRAPGSGRGHTGAGRARAVQSRGCVERARLVAPPKIRLPEPATTATEVKAPRLPVHGR
jgi:Domain of unknown function (DUF4407)